MGFLEGEGVLLDLPILGVSERRDAEGGSTGPSSTIQSFKSIRESRETRLGVDGDGERDLLDEAGATNGAMGWNVLAVGEIGDSRRLDEVRLSAVGVDSEGAVVDIEHDSASNAWILDWRDAEGIADDRQLPTRPRPSERPHVIGIVCSIMGGTYSNPDPLATCPTQATNSTLSQVTYRTQLRMSLTPARLLPDPNGNQCAIRKRLFPLKRSNNHNPTGC